MATRTKKKIYLQYRYHREDAWKQYDWTQVESRASSLFEDMRHEHPGAEYRRISR